MKHLKLNISATTLQSLSIPEFKVYTSINDLVVISTFGMYHDRYHYDAIEHQLSDFDASTLEDIKLVIKGNTGIELSNNTVCYEIQGSSGKAKLRAIFWDKEKYDAAVLAITTALNINIELTQTELNILNSLLNKALKNEQLTIYVPSSMTKSGIDSLDSVASFNMNGNAIQFNI